MNKIIISSLRLLIFFIIIELLVVKSIAYADNEVSYYVIIEDNNIIISGEYPNKKIIPITNEIKKPVSTSIISIIGDIIYFAVQQDWSNKSIDILSYSVISKNITKITIIQGDFPSSDNVSPDGKYVIFSDDDRNGKRKPKHTRILNLQSGKQWNVAFKTFPDKIINKYSIWGNAKIDGDWKWYWDSNFKWDNDSRSVAFRRCSGDADKPVCPLYLVDMADGKKELTPSLVAENLAVNDQRLLNYIPIGFVKNTLLFSTPVDNYLYDFRTKQHRLLIKDAWGGAISPDRKTLAYVKPGALLGDANLWVFDLNKNASRKLTNFQNVDIHGSWVTWSFYSPMICFGWTEAKEMKDYFWTISPDGTSMQKRDSLSPCSKKHTIKMSEASFNTLSSQK